MVLGKLDMYMQKNEGELNLIPYTKIKPKDQRPKYKTQNNETLRRKHRTKALQYQVWQ